jgi:hypothetical protein
MSPEVRDAIESVCDEPAYRHPWDPYPKKKHDFDAVRVLLLKVAQELPDGMTIRELCDELHHAENQGA